MSRAFTLLEDALRLRSISTDGVTRDYWDYQCRQIADYLIQRWA